jgi:predicted dehydrogenase
MIKLYGSKAELELHWDHGVLISAKGARKVFKAKGSSYYHQFEHFADAVLRGVKLRVSPAETLADLKFMQAIVDAR